jgi:hypothetical protein
MSISKTSAEKRIWRKAICGVAAKSKWRSVKASARNIENRSEISGLAAGEGEKKSQSWPG